MAESRGAFIVPALDEGAAIAGCLQALAAARARGCEVIVVDGGSTDATIERARPLADRVTSAPRGRAAQMNAGAALTRADWLCFVHADTRVPDDVDLRIAAALAPEESGAQCAPYANDDGARCAPYEWFGWGRFDVRFDIAGPLLRMVAGAMNLRSRLSGIATGDQALFVTRALFERVGGFAPIGLMEDVELSRALKRHVRPQCLRARVTTSSRRWRRNGVARTVWKMWRLRARHALGADPARLAAEYGPCPSPDSES
ncbi:MAG: glycosyltransferase family 2 protein [Chromatiales bacterium]|nr:glycosyltransferase family 2 protein [Chromatiales bacterium]